MCQASMRDLRFSKQGPSSIRPCKLFTWTWLQRKVDCS